VYVYFREKFPRKSKKYVFLRENAKTNYSFNPTSALKETGRCVAELGIDLDIDYSTMSVTLIIFNVIVRQKHLSPWNQCIK
jgi:hypothetical protein